MSEFSKNINIELKRYFMDKLDKHYNDLIDKFILKNKDKIIEKIAFSLFIQHYYSYEFSSQISELYYKIHLEKIKNIWISGKEKNKLKFFFDLAIKIYDLDLSNIDPNKESNNDNNA